MRATLGLLLFINLFILPPVIAQSEVVSAEPRTELSLRLLPENLVDGVPQAFRFALTNVGDDDLRLPIPEIDCGNVSWRGSVLLEESWLPSDGTSGSAKGQGACDRGELYTGRLQPSIVQRASSWTRLRPGESIYILANAANLHYESKRPGLYEFSGAYVPPSLSIAQLQLLKSAGINVPRLKIKSEKLQYVKPSR